MPTIFVNFRTGDETFAAVLIDEKMTQRFGSDAVFRDARSIELGEEFTAKLWGSLAESQILLAVIGPRWLTIETDGVRRLDMPGDYVRDEIAQALASGVRVVPVLIGDTPMPKADQLPESIIGLAHRQYIRVHPRNAHRDLAILADELSRLLAPQARPVGAPGSPLPIEVSDQSRYLIIAARIEGFGALPDREQIQARQTMYDRLRAAVLAAGLDWNALGRMDRVHSASLLIPQPSSPAAVVTALVNALGSGAGGPRLRIAVHSGLAEHDATGWVGSALTHAADLADVPVLATVLGKATDSRLAVIVSDGFYHDVVRTGQHELDPSRFAFTSGGSLAGWVFVPGYPYPPGVPDPGKGPETATAKQAKKPRATTVFMGPVVGNVNTGSGDQHNYAGGERHGS